MEYSWKRAKEEAFPDSKEKQAHSKNNDLQSQFTTNGLENSIKRK
jgi:hypothetical protein